MSTENKESQQDDAAKTQSEQANTASPAGKKPADKKAAAAKKAGRPAPAPKAPAAKAKKGDEHVWDGQKGYGGTGR
jgi:hypothetical protein